MERFELITEKLKRANQSLMSGRSVEAVIPLREALALMIPHMAEQSSFSGIVNIQAALMAVKAGDQQLAKLFAKLVVSETADYLETLGKIHQQQVEEGHIEDAQRTLIGEYSYAVAFIPQITGVRRINLLRANADDATPEVAALSLVLNHVRPQLDTANWSEWPYPEKVRAKAAYWSAYALVHFGQLLLGNRDSGKDVEVAQELVWAALNLLKDHPQDQLTADASNLSGQIFLYYGTKEHISDAITCFEDAIAIQDRLGNLDQAASDRSNIGAAYQKLAGHFKVEGQPLEEEQASQKAEQYYLAACDHLRGVQSYKGLAESLQNLGIFYSEREEYAKAQAALGEAWEAAGKPKSEQIYLKERIAGNLGGLLCDQHNYAEAETWLRRALGLFAEHASIPPDPEVYLVAHGNLGVALLRLGRAAEAYEHLRMALSRIESYRLSFLSERAGLGLIKSNRWIYEAMIDCCATLSLTQPHYGIESFDLAEKVRWRSLTALLRFLPLGLLDAQNDPLLIEEGQLLDRAGAALGAPASTAASSYPAIFERLEQIWEALAPRYPGYVAIRRQHTVTADEMITLLDDQVPVMIEYYLGDQYGTAMAFVLNKTGGAPAVVRIGASLAELDRLVADLRTENGVGAGKRFNEISQQLYDLLMRPLLQYIPEGAGICIVPAGSLHNLPFAALFDGRHYLIERNSLVIAPGASALRWWISKDRKNRRSCLIFSATSGLASTKEKHPDLFLFQALAEKKLAPLFSNSFVVRPEEASRERFQRETGSGATWDVLHIACHGIAGKRGLDSYLVMAGDPSHPDKNLTAGKITSEVRIGTTLVTLSACDSAVAEVSTGEEVAGLTHAFLLAGSSSVLSTLFPIRQDAGVELTRSFYESWLGKQGRPASKMAALQKAQQDMMRRRSWLGFGPRKWCPLQWSAFQLYGNWQ